MKIMGGIDNIARAYRAEKVEKKENKETVSETRGEPIKDKVTISSEAKTSTRALEVEFAKKRLSSMGDAKNERVAELKQKIQDGTYNVDMEKVAEAILDKLI